MSEYTEKLDAIEARASQLSEPVAGFITSGEMGDSLRLYANKHFEGLSSAQGPEIEARREELTTSIMKRKLLLLSDSCEKAATESEHKKAIANLGAHYVSYSKTKDGKTRDLSEVEGRLNEVIGRPPPITPLDKFKANFSIQAGLAEIAIEQIELDLGYCHLKKDALSDEAVSSKRESVKDLFEWCARAHSGLHGIEQSIQTTPPGLPPVPWKADFN